MTPVALIYARVLEWKWMEMDGNGWIDEMVRNKIEIKNL
jgi:hypothetical protein